MTIIKFTLEPDREYVELNQLLKLVGLAGSGGMGKAIVASGLVSVNGQTELRKTCKIVAGNIVHFEEHEIQVVNA
jgi:ribosome-associated protein